MQTRANASLKESNTNEPRLHTVATRVPLKDWRPKLHTIGCPFKGLDPQVAVEWTTAQSSTINEAKRLLGEPPLKIGDSWIYLPVLVPPKKE